MNHIRSKILIIIIGGLLFTSIISTLSIVIIIRSTLREQTIQRFQSLLGNMADYVVEPVLNHDKIQLQELVKRTIKANPDIEYMFILSSKGELLASSFLKGVPRELLQANLLNKGRITRLKTLATQKGHLMDFGQAILKGQAGQIHLGVHRRLIFQVTNRAVHTLLLIQGCALGLALIASLILAEILVRPLHRFLEVVGQVRQGNLTVQTGLTSSDEIGKLAEAFDGMVGALRKSQEHLRELVTQARGVVSSVPNALLITDRAGWIRSVNPAACRITGFSEEELSQKNLAILFISGPEKKPVLDLMAHLKKQETTVSYAMELLQREGNTLAVAFHAAPMLAEDQSLQGFVVEIRDLKQLRIVIEELKQQRDILEELRKDSLFFAPASEEKVQTYLVRSDKLVTLGQLAASLAHELNNPLFGIITCARILQRELEGTELDVLEDVDMIHKEALRCSKIVKSFLQYSRLGHPNRQEVYLGSILDDVRALIEPKARQQQIQLDYRIQGDGLVEADGEQLTQVFLNLKMNALQAMEKGGVLSVEMDGDEKWVWIDLSDTGLGISQENLARVMEPFFTTKDRESGTGLGLPISRGIVERHGGKLEITSAPGQGTRVRVIFPRKEMGKEEL